jgi:plastocyanin
MSRALAGLLILVLAVAVAAPAGSAAPPDAHAAAKCKKHRKHNRRHRRCRKAAVGNGIAGDESGGASTPGRLGVTEREISASQLQMQLSRPSVSAGSTIVEQQNTGEDPHNLVLEKGDGSVFTYPTLDPGSTQKQTLYLTKGTWTLYCSLLNHRDLGMQATLTVN